RRHDLLGARRDVEARELLRHRPRLARRVVRHEHQAHAARARRREALGRVRDRLVAAVGHAVQVDEREVVPVGERDVAPEQPGAHRSSSAARSPALGTASTSSASSAASTPSDSSASSATSSSSAPSASAESSASSAEPSASSASDSSTSGSSASTSASSRSSSSSVR